MKSHVTMQLSCAKNHEACNPYANNSFLSRESLGMVMHHVLHNVCHSRSQRCSLGTSAVLLGIICSRLINVAAAESRGTRGREARPDNGGVSIMSASQDTTTATQTRGIAWARQKWLIRTALWTPGNDPMTDVGDASIMMHKLLTNHCLYLKSVI